MLPDFEALEASDPRAAELATRAIAELLRCQFIHVGDRGSAPLLNLLQRPAPARLVRAFFDTAGYRLVVQEREGWAGILPDSERIVLPRMRIDETLVLLLLARLWQEAVQEGDVEELATVVLTLNDAYEAYRELVARARRPALTLQRFLDILRDLERRAVLRLGGYDGEAQDHELTIRPIVNMLTGDELLGAIDAFLDAAGETEGEGEADADPAEAPSAENRGGEEPPP